MKRFKLKKLNEAEGKDQYRVEVSNRFAALEDFEAEVEFKNALGIITEKIKISAKDSLSFFNCRSISHGSLKDAQN
jgi:hypothetical protein